MGAREATIKIISFNSIPSSWWNKAGRFYLEARAWQVGGARAQLVSLTNQKESERERREREGGGRERGRRVQSGGYHRTLVYRCWTSATSNKQRSWLPRIISPAFLTSGYSALYIYSSNFKVPHRSHLHIFSVFCVFLLLMRALSKPERATHQPTGPIYFKALVTFIDSVRGFQDRVYWLWHYGAQCRWKRLHLGGFRGKLYDTIYLA